jgi:hypothetical protein
MCGRFPASCIVHKLSAVSRFLIWNARDRIRLPERPAGSTIPLRGEKICIDSLDISKPVAYYRVSSSTWI